MAEQPDRSEAIIRPLIGLALAIIVSLALDWLYPLPFVPAQIPHVPVGGTIFAAAFALFVWAIVTIRRAGTQVETVKPTTAIVADGPYRFTRNPIYLGMMVGLTGLAVAFDTLWLMVALIVFYFVIRYGVVAREEAYLERKFGRVYLDYKQSVHRWI